MGLTKHVIFCLSLLLLIFSSCDKNRYDRYERPEWLGGPIYQQLQKEGRFKHFIACLDTTGYDEILDRTGYFTVFAPGDSAFEAYFMENGISSVNEMDTGTIKNIVEYAIIDNGYTIRQLGAFQSSLGWVYGNAYKRITRSNSYMIKDTVFDVGKKQTITNAFV